MFKAEYMIFLSSKILIREFVLTAKSLLLPIVITIFHLQQEHSVLSRNYSHSIEQRYITNAGERRIEHLHIWTLPYDILTVTSLRLQLFISKFQLQFVLLTIDFFAYFFNFSRCVLHVKLQKADSFSSNNYIGM